VVEIVNIWWQNFTILGVFFIGICSILAGYIGHSPTTLLNIDYRNNLLSNITYELESEEFKGHANYGQRGVFSRDRKLTIRNLVVIIVKSQSAIQRELDSFAKEMSGSSFNIREVTKSAFTQARAKLNPWAFKRLNDVAVKSFYSEANFLGWNGIRVLAVDGTRMMLPNHPSITEEFGLPTPGPGQEVVRPLAMGSLLYDVLNQITIDAEMAPYSWSEQDLLLVHLEKVEPGDLLLLDRGYPSHWLFFLLMAKQIHFCIRVPEKWSTIVKDFSQSELQEQIVQFTLNVV
jgi:hypothetical protein